MDPRRPNGPRRPPAASPDGFTVGPSLPREEYVEQAYFFRTLLERLKDNLPVQELMESIAQEILATTKLPLAINYLLTELKHTGGCATAMGRLNHYFSPFQTFLMREAEDDRGRMDLRVSLAILQKEAAYRTEEATPQGVFLYQFETLCRNRLNYDRGLAAAAGDPMFDASWREWILTVRRQVGLVDLADLIYVRSEFYWTQARRRGVDPGGSRAMSCCSTKKRAASLMPIAARTHSCCSPRSSGTSAIPKSLDWSRQILYRSCCRSWHVDWSGWNIGSNCWRKNNVGDSI